MTEPVSPQVRALYNDYRNGWKQGASNLPLDATRVDWPITNPLVFEKGHADGLQAFQKAMKEFDVVASTDVNDGLFEVASGDPRTYFKVDVGSMPKEGA